MVSSLPTRTPKRGRRPCRYSKMPHTFVAMSPSWPMRRPIYTTTTTTTTRTMLMRMNRHHYYCHVWIWPWLHKIVKRRPWWLSTWPKIVPMMHPAVVYHQDVKPKRHWLIYQLWLYHWPRWMYLLPPRWRKRPNQKTLSIMVCRNGTFSSFFRMLLCMLWMMLCGWHYLRFVLYFIVRMIGYDCMRVGNVPFLKILKRRNRPYTWYIIYWPWWNVRQWSNRPSNKPSVRYHHHHHHQDNPPIHWLNTWLIRHRIGMSIGRYCIPDSFKVYWWKRSMNGLNR